MVLILVGSPDIALGLFISKIITQQYRFQAEKRSLRAFGGYHQKNWKWYFSGKLIKKLHVSHKPGKE